MPPSRTPDSAVVPVLLAKANTLRGFQHKCLSWWGGLVLLPIPPCAPPTPLPLSVLVGKVGFVTWFPSRTSDSDALLYLSILVGWGVVIDTWPPSRTHDSAVSIRPGG